jgi:hypothetical protein
VHERVGKGGGQFEYIRRGQHQRVWCILERWTWRFEGEESGSGGGGGGGKSNYKTFILFDFYLFFHLRSVFLCLLFYILTCSSCPSPPTARLFRWLCRAHEFTA